MGLESHPSPGARAPWYVPREVTPRYSFFISKVGENDEEVIRLKAEIMTHSTRAGREGLTCFLDRHDWLPSTDFSRVIRQALLESEHMVAWVTPEYLERSSRGWVWLELAYAELLDESIERDREALRPLPFIIPVFHRVSGIDQVVRTPLLNYWQRNLLGHRGAESIETIAHRLVELYDVLHLDRGR